MAAVLTTKKSMPPGMTSHLCPDYDAIAKLRSELQRVPNLIISWVKAHQDKKKLFHDLPINTQLNCIADKDAEQFCTSASLDLQPTEALPELLQNKAYMIVNGTVVTNNLKEILQDNYDVINIRQYVKKKTSLQDNVMGMINWDTLGRNLKKQHLFNQIRLEKETWQHLLCCTHDDSIAIRTLAVTKFKSSLLQCKTALIICSTLIYKLSQWLGLATAPPPIIPSDRLGMILCTTVEEQAEIGWENFIKGRISICWGDAQQIFYNTVHPTGNYSKSQWNGKIITGVWQIFFDVWKACNAHLHGPLDAELPSHLNKR
eukprot:3303316-Ditylum_brightwellii.AAC.1